MCFYRSLSDDVDLTLSGNLLGEETSSGALKEKLQRRKEIQAWIKKQRQKRREAQAKLSASQSIPQLMSSKSLPVAKVIVVLFN